ncbi:MAG: hypothetical protein ACRKFN_11930 [Desulfitobacterium sp.]
METKGIDRLFLEQWKKLDFTEWNESDIREEFIAPLLIILGYSKGTINDVIREKTLNLTEAYHRIGRKRVSIDYIPTVRLKSFWIIEAKPGSKKRMDYGDLLQAHLYAIHPEIKVPFIMLTNGWEIRIYDAITVDSWENPLYICSQNDCFETFEGVKQITGAKQILSYQRKRVLDTIKDSFVVEIDDEQVRTFTREVNKVLQEASSIVSENARQLRITSWKKAEEKEKEHFRNMDIKLLLVHMDLPTDGRVVAAGEYLRRIIEADPTERNRLVDLLAMNYRARPHAIFRVLSTYILLGLLNQGIEVERSLYVASVKSAIEELVKANITYWAQSPISNALCHLDNVTLRLAKKIGIRIGMEPLTKLIEELKRVLEPEELLKENPSVSKHMVGYIGLLGESLWRKFSRNLEEEIWQGIWLMQILEEEIDKIPIPKYPDGNSDLLFFESYGKGFDMLCVGTWDVLHDEIDTLRKTNISNEIINFASLSREEVINSIPRERQSPEGWQPNGNSIHQLINFLKA